MPLIYRRVSWAAQGQADDCTCSVLILARVCLSSPARWASSFHLMSSGGGQDGPREHGRSRLKKSDAIILHYKARTFFIPPGFERCFRSVLASSQRTLEQLLVRSIFESNQNGQVAGFSLFGCVPGNENEAICFCLCVRDDPVSSLARLAFSIATSKSKENKNYFWFLHDRPSVTIHLNFTIQFSEAFTWAGFPPHLLLFSQSWKCARLMTASPASCGEARGFIKMLNRRSFKVSATNGCLRWALLRDWAKLGKRWEEAVYHLKG